METADDSVLRWYAVYTKRQHEKAVAAALRSKGLEELLPLYNVSRRWTDRIKRLELPLFPGYVFCRFNASDRLPILKTPGVHFVVGTREGGPAPIPDSEIAQLRTIVASGLPARPHPYLKVGQKVLIHSGPLAGVEGILLKFKSAYRLILSITLLQRSVAVEVGQEDVAGLHI